MHKQLVVKRKVPIYYGEVIIVFTDDFIAAAHDIGVELRSDANTFGGLSFRKGLKQYVMLLTLKPGWDIMAHEALHIVNFILHDRGVEVSTSNDEAQAYLLSWVIKQIEFARKIANV